MDKPKRTLLNPKRLFSPFVTMDPKLVYQIMNVSEIEFFFPHTGAIEVRNTF
jgi:hypothetical protein